MDRYFHTRRRRRTAFYLRQPVSSTAQRSPLILQGFVIEHTVAVALEIRIGNLILKLLAHTFGCLCAFSAAGTVSAGALESFPDGIDNLLIGIELDFHVRHLFLDCGFIIPQDKSFLCDEVTLRKFLYKPKRAVKQYVRYRFTALYL